MYKCPTCNKIKDKPMDLAKHMVYPSGDEKIDKEHREWIESKNLDLSKGFKPLAELLASLYNISKSD